MTNICAAPLNNIQAISIKTSVCAQPYTNIIPAIQIKTFTESQSYFTVPITPNLVKTFREPIATVILPATSRPATGQFWPRQVTQRTVATTNTTSSNTLSFAATYGAF